MLYEIRDLWEMIVIVFDGFVYFELWDLLEEKVKW